MVPRARDPKRAEAFMIYKKNDGKINLVEIASRLKVSPGTVRGWKSKDSWDNKIKGTLPKKRTERSKRKQGAQPGNKNAVGHGGPPGNSKAVKHGLFQKYLPQETLDIINEMPTDPLDVLWNQIQIANAAIIRAQRIMWVKDKDDKTKELVESGDTDKYDVQQAWDKQANFMKAQATAQSSLRSMVKQYDELLNKRWDLATEEQKARIEHLKASTKAGDQVNTEDKVKKLFDQIGGELDESE